MNSAAANQTSKPVAATGTRAAVRLFAQLFFEQFLANYLGVTGDYARSSHPRQRPELLARWVVVTLNGNHFLRTRLLAPPRHGDYDPTTPLAGRKLDARHEEMVTYPAVLLRPIAVKTVKGSKDNDIPVLTSTHRLLEDLVRAASDEPAWRDARVMRCPGRPAWMPHSGDPRLSAMASRLGGLFAAEQRRQQTARSEGLSHGYRKSSSSKSQVERHGHVHLCIGGWTVAVPEEMGIGDVLMCLPAPLLASFFADYDIARLRIADRVLEMAEAGADPLAGLEDSAADELEAAGRLTEAFAVWRRVERLFETLNADYGQKVVKTGLPSSIGLGLSFDTAMALVDLRLEAVRVAKGAPLEPRHWEGAWRNLQNPDGSYGGYDRWFSFYRSAEGQFLVHGRSTVRFPEPDGSGRSAASEPAVPAPDRRFETHLDRWQARNDLTDAEILATKWCLARWNASLARHNQTAFHDPALAGVVAARLAADFPYRLAELPALRFKLFEFFFRRRMAFLLERGDVPGLPTAAETLVLQVMDGKGAPETLDALILDLQASAGLGNLFRKMPYCWVPAEARLDVLLFFFDRDVRSLPRRPA